MTINNLRSVQRVVWDARAEWYNIGLELELDPSTLDEIKMNNDDISDRFRGMLTQWLRQVSPPPTWSALAAALQSPTVEFGHLAEQVESIYVADVTYSDSATEAQGGEFIV